MIWQDNYNLSFNGEKTPTLHTIHVIIAMPLVVKQITKIIVYGMYPMCITNLTKKVFAIGVARL